MKGLSLIKNNKTSRSFISIIALILIFSFSVTNVVWAYPVSRDMSVPTLSPPSFSADPDAYTRWFTSYMLIAGAEEFPTMSVPSVNSYMHQLDILAKEKLSGTECSYCVSWEAGESSLFVFLADARNVRVVRFFSPGAESDDNLPVRGLKRNRFKFSNREEAFNKYLNFEILAPVNTAQKNSVFIWRNFENLFASRFSIGTAEPRDPETMSHRFKEAGAVVKRAAGLKSLKKKKKEIFLDVFLPHMTSLGEDGRRVISETAVVDLYNDLDVVTRRLLLEAMVEASVIGSRNPDTDLSMNIFRQLVRDEDNPSFVEDLVALYMLALNRKLFLDQANYSEFEDMLIDIVRELSEENPIFRTRLERAFSEYGDYEWKSLLDLSEAEQDGLDRFVSRSALMSGLEFADKKSAMDFSETYFYLTLAKSLASSFLAEEKGKYLITSKGVEHLVNEITAGILTYPQVLELTHDLMPELHRELLMFFEYEKDKKLIENLKNYRHEIAGWINAMQQAIFLLKSSPGWNDSYVSNDLELMFSEINKMHLKLDRAKNILAEIAKEEEYLLTAHPLQPDKFNERRKRFARVMNIAVESSNLLHYYFLKCLEIDFDDLIEPLPEDVRFIPAMMRKKLRDASCKTYSFVRAEGGIDSMRDIQEHDLNEIIEIESKAFLVSGGTVELSLGSIPAVEADSTLLTEIVTNLMKNGLDSMKWHHPLSVKTWHDADADEVVMEVADTGVGIPENMKEKIFEREVSTKKDAGGSGLGLQITKMIVEEFGGTITFQSEAGKGTTFIVRFPATEGFENTTGPEAEGGSQGIEWEEYQEKAGLANGLSTVLREEDLQKGWFTRKDFQKFFRGKGAKGATYGKTDVMATLEGLVSLGALKSKRDGKKTGKPFVYRVMPAYLKYDAETQGTIKNLLSVLLTRPDEQKISEVRDKVEKQITGSGNDVIHYYQRTLPRLKMRLIAFDGKMSLIETQLARHPDDPVLKVRRQKCMDEFDYLLNFLRMEIDLLSPPDYDLERTGGVNYRDIVKDHLSRALGLARSLSIKRAIDELELAGDTFSKEYKKLYGSKVKARRPYVVADIENDLYQILRGYYYKHYLKDGRTTLSRDEIYATSTERLQSMRSEDRAIDGNLNEMGWLVENGRALNGIIALIKGKIQDGEPLDDEESRQIEEIISSQVEMYRHKTAESNVTAYYGMVEAREALKDGNLESLMALVTAVRDCFRRRYSNNKGIIENVRSGSLESARQGFLVRNYRLRNKINNVIAKLDRGDVSRANALIMDLVNHEKELKKSSEFYRMINVLWGASRALTDKHDLELARSYMQEASGRMYLEEFLNDFMAKLRDFYVDRRIEDPSLDDFNRLFVSFFNTHLKVAKEKGIGRGSPRLLLAYYYLFAYVSKHMIKPGTKSSKISNPAFFALQELVWMLEVDSVDMLAAAFDRQSHKKPSLKALFEGLKEKGRVSVSSLAEKEYIEVIMSVMSDHNVPEAKEAEVLRVSGVSNEAVALADVKDLDIYWQDILTEFEKQVESGIAMANNIDRYRDLIGFSKDPSKWHLDLDREWEEDFVKAISQMPSDDLAEKFKSYYPQGTEREKEYVSRIKDLRGIAAIKGGAGSEGYLADIFPNIFITKPIDKAALDRDRVEMLWILREWIYRHYDNKFKERSYDIMMRGKSQRELLPMLDFASCHANLISWRFDTFTELPHYEVTYSVSEDGRITFELPEHIKAILEVELLNRDLEHVLQKAADFMHDTMDRLVENGVMSPMIKKDIVKDIKESADLSRGPPPRIKIAKDLPFTAAKEPKTNTIWLNSEWNRLFQKYHEHERFGKVVTALLAERLFHEIPHLPSETMQIVRDFIYLNYIDEDLQKEIDAFFDLEDVKNSGVSSMTKFKFQFMGNMVRKEGPTAEEILLINQLVGRGELDTLTSPNGREFLPMVNIPAEGEGLFNEMVIKKSVKEALPQLVLAMQSAAASRKAGQFRVVLDSKLGKGQNARFISKVREALNKLTLRDDLLGGMIRNVDFRMADVSNLSANDKKAGLIIASMDRSNDEPLADLEGATSILRLDDSELTQEYYYPAAEVIFFGLARAAGYDRSKLENILSSIPNVDEDNIDWTLLNEANSGKILCIRIIPDAVKWPDGKLESWITDYILSNA